MGHQKYNILYVDDEQSNLRVFKTIYRHYYNIYSAISAEEAFLILENNPIHLIISDQRMPEMTGVEFLKEVKKKWPEPKYILLTAYSDHEVLKEAINVVGIWRYINKPYDHDDLRLVMDNALEAYQLKIDKDILNSERLKAEAKIKESEEKFRTFTESA
ncbi:MAG: response regulator, partial [Bacteroidetes bacterium]|nr:response regulator [Bacteroidota bacterium]